MRRPLLLLLAVPLAGYLALGLGAGCGGGSDTTSSNSFTESAGPSSGSSSSHPSGSGGAGGGGQSTGAGKQSSGSDGVGGSIQLGDSGPGCTGLACQIHACSGNGATTISGTIYDPAGKNPIYGVVAYVPNSAVKPLDIGASCSSCSDLFSGDPVAAAVTDANGHFTIKNAPDGTNIPLVIQVGKWRRQFTLPSVGMCIDTGLTDGMLTLPKNGSEGDLPQIGISTGGADTLECLLRRVGVDAAEYEPGDTGTGHIHIFQGDGGPNTSPKAPVSSTSLWDSATDLKKYDIVMLSCEGAETKNPNQQALFDYAAAGGRVFASHFHYKFFNSGPFASYDLATWKTGGQDLGNITADVVTSWNGMPFERGQALHDWLANTKVNALVNGKLPIDVAKHNADVTTANTRSQPWITNSADANQAQDFTFDTPLDADAGAQCGRVAFTDMHVGATPQGVVKDYSTSSTTPKGCADRDLSPQEKALEFILFDLSSCVTPNNMPITPPGQVN